MRERGIREGRRYAAVPNDAMRDAALSIEARGLLALLMTYSDEWRFNREHLMGLVGCGKDRFGKMMTELVQAGYVEVVFLRDEAGRLIGKNWVVRDDKTIVRNVRTMDRDPENPDVRDNRRPEKPSSGKSAPIRRPILKEDQLREEDQGAGKDQPDLLSPEEAPKADLTQESFDRFWSVYPKKAGKPNSLKAFKKAVREGVDPEQIIEGAEIYAEQVEREGTEPKFVKFPQGWLNDHRWEGLKRELSPEQIRLRAIRDRGLEADRNAGEIRGLYQ